MHLYPIRIVNDVQHQNDRVEQPNEVLNEMEIYLNSAQRIKLENK